MLTKKDLQEIEKLMKPLVYQLLQESQDDLKKTLENKMTEFKSDILDAVDGVMGEIKKSREEQIVASSHLSDHTDKLEKHEGRISKLEKVALVS